MTKDKSEYLIERYDNVYEVVIGLEVHAQVTSNSKLFSSSSTEFGAEPNTQVSLVDAAFPGMLPVINEFCVKQAIKTGIGLRAQINKRSVFDRKNYFYADLPQGYQISQFKYPIVGEGKVVLDMPNGQKEVGIERLHLEQDAGKSIHDIDPQNTLVDLNRSGVALMEIVSKPDLRSPDEVSAYIKKLRSIMRYLGTCDGNMQEGSLRADVNVSVRLKDTTELGTRCEIKNVNSIKFMQMAIDYEANRQVDLIEEGKSIDQETRLFDTKKNETRSMRSKEDAHDYRYFPDPDLLPLEVTDEFIDKLKSSIPELPDDKKKRFIDEFKVSPYEATILVSDIDTAKYFEEVVAKMGKNQDIKLAVNWITGELFAVLNNKNLEISQSPISAKNLAKLVNLIKNGTISGKIAKTIFELMMDGDKDPQIIVEEKGLKQESDPKTLEALIDKIIDDNREKAIEYKNGKEKTIWFLCRSSNESFRRKSKPSINKRDIKEKALIGWVQT
jgi:aspartyl-tRNA(Asn)/glutamyl-tRNA(Gln) amidotransferase subunit B